MALKATIYKANVQLSDIDRGIYGDYPLTIARHPSETDERMLIRLLAFALNVLPDDSHGTLEFAKDMWDADEPALWHKDLTGQILHWIETGQPDEKRLLRTTSRVGRVSVYSFSASTPIWWKGDRPTAHPRAQPHGLADSRGAKPRALRARATLHAVASHRAGRRHLGRRRHPLDRSRPRAAVRRRRGLGGGAASVTVAAVRCRAWSGVIGFRLIAWVTPAGLADRCSIRRR